MVPLPLPCLITVGYTVSRTHTYITHSQEITAASQSHIPAALPKALSIDWFKEKITGTSYISWENLWFPVDFPRSQPIDPGTPCSLITGMHPMLRPQLPKLGMAARVVWRQ